jgi:hypothetical protein
VFTNAEKGCYIIQSYKTVRKLFSILIKVFAKAKNGYIEL